MSSDPMTRRQFLFRLGAGAGAAMAAGALAGHLIPEPGDGPDSPPAARAVTGADGILVLVGLYGGNDGLNTVVPYADPAYRSARPTLGYQPQEVLDLDGNLGLSPKLPGLHGLWAEQRLAVVLGVGYPDPDLSHFASMAVWQSGVAGAAEATGWVGRWLDRSWSGPLTAVSIGATLPPSMRGAQRAATALVSSHITLPGSPEFQSAYSAITRRASDRTGLAAQVAASGADLVAARDALERLGGGNEQPAVGTDLSLQLGVVSGLIAAGSPTRVYHVSLNGFDNHAAEQANHERLLGELDSSLTTFTRAVPAGRSVVVMTYSEFGRRPVQNASGGTDHGTAAPVLVVKAGGGRTGFRGGLFGEQPSLTSLDGNGNLRYTVDFRSVYATVLGGVLGSDPEPVLGGRFAALPFV